MRKALVALALLGAALMQTSCGDDPNADNDVKYMDMIDHDHVPHGWTQNMPDLGRRACKDLDAGTALGNVVVSVANLTKDGTTTVENPLPTTMFTMAQSQAIVYDAIAVYCPDHQGEIAK